MFAGAEEWSLDAIIAVKAKSTTDFTGYFFFFCEIRGALIY
jgi:hypothetical protein